ncbi:MAG: Blue-light-activated protein [Syntrophus sp. PtaB.Bin138]|nr:MAG: Blue-light-activated protein [Syntrophus sp. PtaB.Bin138]
MKQKFHGQSIFPWSIRTQLLTLVLAAVLPAMMIILHNGMQLRDDKIAEAQEKSLYLARSLATQQEHIAKSTKQILQALAQIPQIRNLEAKACDALFHDLVAQNPTYVFIGIADIRGRVFASSHSVRPSSIADRKHFQEAVRSRDYSVGEYVITRTANTPSLNFGYPVMDHDGNVIAVLVAALNLDVYRLFLADHNYVADYVVGITDHRGIRLFRFPDTDSKVTGIGVKVSETSYAHLSGTAEEGVYEGKGSDGNYRIYAFRKLRLHPRAPVYGHIFVGVSKDAVLAAANQELIQSLMLLGLALVLALAAAWSLGNVSFINKLKKLADSAQRLAQGEPHVKTGVPYGRDELGNLAESFDNMSTSLQRKEDERKQAAAAFVEEATKRNILFEQSPDGILIIDPSTTKFLEFNTAAHRQLGYSREEFARMSISDVEAMESPSEIENRIRSVIQRGRVDFDTRQRTRQGEIRDIHVTAQIIDIMGRSVYHCIWRDITDRRRAEAEHRALEERLQRAERMEALGLLAGGVAHDLNNVIGILIGYSELLLDEVDSASPLRPHAEYIKVGGERAAAIIQDLLTLARRGVQTRDVVNLNSVIEDLHDSPELQKLCSFHPHVKVETVCAPDLLNVKGSPVHLRKTVMNLVSNAAEAMPRGGIVSIQTTNRYLDRPVPGYDEIHEGDFVVLSVSDTGEGISADDMKRMFEPFYTKKIMGRSGTGLGLAVVWGTVKDHDGYINVQSVEGKGTTFTLYFPVTREEAPDERQSIPVSEYMGRGESILVVDDVQGQRELAGRMLTKLNYRVTMAGSGEAAVAHLEKNGVDLIVLDMIMDPGMDGLDTYRKILEVRPEQKAIIVSGFSESDRVRQAQAMGAGAYIRKPYHSENLGLAVRKALDHPAFETKNV